MKRTKEALSLMLVFALTAMLFPVYAYADTPSIIAPASINVTEDTETALYGIAFSGTDANLAVSFVVTSGTLCASSKDGVNAEGNNTSHVTLTGSPENLNSYITGGNLAFITDDNMTQNIHFEIYATDNNTPGWSGSATVALTVSAVNDAPANSVPGTQSVLQDGVLVFSAGKWNSVSISDVDAGAGIILVTLTASNGLITLSGTSGLSFIVGSGTGDFTMTFEGNVVDINSALQGMSFSPTGGYYGPACMQISTNDLGLSGSGGNQTDTDTINISVVPLYPTVLSVHGSTANGIYGIGDRVDILMEFDQPVIVLGRPELLLETGDIDRFASYISGSGTRTLTFTYFVQAGDITNVLNYASTEALVLNAGYDIVSALSDNSAIRTLPALNGGSSLADLSNIVIFGMVAPAITGSTAMTLTEGYAATATSTYDVTGYPSPTVTKTSGNDKITWNGTDKILQITAGLTAGTYPVVLTATNGISPDVTLTFTLTVNAAPASPVVPTITSLPSSYTFYVGGQVTLAPRRAGGIWNYDHTYLSMTQNGDQYTFTALKKGSTTLTYTVNGASYSVSLTINDISVPKTGDKTTPVGYIMLGFAAFCAAGAVMQRKKA